MSWLKTHWLGVLSIVLTTASFIAGLGVDRLLPSKAPALTLPAEISAEPNGDLVKISAAGNGGSLLWDVQPRLPNFPLDAEHALLVSTKAQGVYVIRCETARDSKIARAECKLTVGDVPPGPGPGPNPPTPPVPPDPFAVSLQAAYTAETDPAKAQHVAFLAAVYEGGAALLTPDVTTAGALFQKLSAAIHVPGIGLPKGALPLVSKVIGDDEAKVFGTDASKPLDVTAVKAAFAHYGAALANLK